MVRVAVVVCWVLAASHAAGAADVTPKLPSAEETEGYNINPASISGSWWRGKMRPGSGRQVSQVTAAIDSSTNSSGVELGTDGGATSGSVRSLLAKQWHFYRSYLPINRPAVYPAYAKYWLPSQTQLPKWYVPKSRSQIYFDNMQKRYIPHSFKVARATYYGIDPAVGDTIDAGSCGYSYIYKGEACGNSCLDIAAISDMNLAYAGSCGRCYEVGCNPAAFTDGYSNYIERINACRNPDQTLVVRITDTCPCVYPKNAYSNRRWCCGDGTAPHFDLSINAFEKLADRRAGVIGLRYREVPCWYQSKNPARRPAQYWPENRKPKWAWNPQRGWNWTADVSSWVTKQRMFPLPPLAAPLRDLKPANVTGAGVTGHIPHRIPKEATFPLKHI